MQSHQYPSGSPPPQTQHQTSHDPRYRTHQNVHDPRYPPPNQQHLFDAYLSQDLPYEEVQGLYSTYNIQPVDLNYHQDSLQYGDTPRYADTARYGDTLRDADMEHDLARDGLGHQDPQLLQNQPHTPRYADMERGLARDGLGHQDPQLLQNQPHTPRYADMERGLARDGLGHQGPQLSQNQPHQPSPLLANINRHNTRASQNSQNIHVLKLAPLTSVPIVPNPAHSTARTHSMGSTASHIHETPVTSADLSRLPATQRESDRSNATSIHETQDTSSRSSGVPDSRSIVPGDVRRAPDPIPARSPSPAISLINPSPTPAATTKLTPADVMEDFKKKTLSELRDLQHTHIRYKKLNLAIKIEAQNLFFDYQRKQHLLSLKYSRPFKLLTKYLGQRRTQQKQSNWHSFQKTNPAAKEALKNTNNNIGQRNKDVSKLYKQHAGTQAALPPQANPNADKVNDPNAEERERFGKIFKSDLTLRNEVKKWGQGVQLKLKELSDSFGVEGFLVLATQDHRKPLFFQGGSFLGDDYLRALLEDGNPMRKFAMWTAGSKATSKKRKSSALAASGSNETAENVDDHPSKKKTKYTVGAFENRDFCQEAAQSKNSLVDKRSRWPGTETVLRLARIDHKLVVHSNPVGLSVEHLVDVPVKKMSIEDTWLVLRGLKNKWIELVEHKFDSLPKSVAVRKRNMAAGTTAITREEDDTECQPM
ncbi:hypothetical protein PGT21_002226 [Puccinia graminis f. sp. tritici]|uniref:Uncharacterized protein n=1 Tax=Puccinia graminis f. sp. tritici TaxID=56615 RepID=A0A5B0MK74_PUCGR|nr:hypothetical protein PGT21_002226 [Puccinia graminis f. sp. tritici]